MAARLSDDAVATELERIDGWTLDNDVIAKEFTFSGFSAAMAFVVEVAIAAEKANHHPDIDIRWNRVRLALTTHDAGGLTQQDIDLATVADGITGHGSG